MKKNVVFGFATLMAIGTCMYAITPVTMATIMGAVDYAITQLYDRIPEAEYTVTIFHGNESESRTVTSASAARGARDAALERGAERVHIESAYPTIHRDCNDNWYDQNHRN